MKAFIENNVVRQSDMMDKIKVNGGGTHYFNKLNERCVDLTY